MKSFEDVFNKHIKTRRIVSDDAGPVSLRLDPEVREILNDFRNTLPNFNQSEFLRDIIQLAIVEIRRERDRMNSEK